MNAGQTSKSNRLVKKSDVKLCTLCGTLNHQGNVECFTCSWHGCFSCDPHTIDLAWQRLEALYEEIRWEHVTPRRRYPVGDSYDARPTPFFTRLITGIMDAWERFLTQREFRTAQRDSRFRSSIPSQPE